jgi:D-alanyl-D-alanine carboxypeptidase
MKPVRAVIVAVAVCLLAAAQAPRASATAESHAQLVARLNNVVARVEALRVPGGVIGVSGTGIGGYQRAFGLSAPGVPMKLDSEFRIASITKTFTATVILELVDRGKLKLSDRISRWEPRLPYSRIVTIRQLLNMTSSIFDEGGAGSLLVEWEQQNCALAEPTPACSQHDWSPQSIVNLAIRQGPQFLPGIWNYSDTNYVLLGLIAQDVTHKPLWLLLKQLIFDPLHLRHTRFPTSSTAMPAPAAMGFQLHGKLVDRKKKKISWGYFPGPVPNPSTLAGAGAIVSDLADLRVWARALATGALLKPRTQRLRLQLLNTGFAFPPLAGTGFEAGLPVSYGLGIGNMGGLLGHNGQYGPLYTSEMWYSPRYHGSVVVLLNSYTPCPALAPVGHVADAVAVSLARIAYGASVQRVAGGPLSGCPVAQAPSGG